MPEYEVRIRGNVFEGASKIFNVCRIQLVNVNQFEMVLKENSFQTSKSKKSSAAR